jgi:tetratricopeptide (TPR) repeat protein
MQMFTKAVGACELALQLRPNDDQLRDELRNLCASMTMEKGKYGKTSDFRGSINNKEAQDRLHSQENIVRSDDTKQQVVQEARKRLEEGRFSPTTVLELADALADLETEAAYQEAFELLDHYFEQTRDFSFKRHQGELKLRQLRAQIRTVNQQLKAEPSNPSFKEQAATLTAGMERQELEHYRLCVENYPTDMRFKYEYGRCLIRAQQFDQAIPLFQEAQKDPKLHLLAMDKTGLCFLLKGWYEDAIDIFQKAIKSCQTQESPLAKDIRYNLARTYEASDKKNEALELYRKLAQLDFSYKDVGQRIDILRKDAKR